MDPEAAVAVLVVVVVGQEPRQKCWCMLLNVPVAVETVAAFIETSSCRSNFDLTGLTIIITPRPCGGVD